MQRDAATQADSKPTSVAKEEAMQIERFQGMLPDDVLAQIELPDGTKDAPPDNNEKLRPTSRVPPSFGAFDDPTRYNGDNISSKVISDSAIFFWNATEEEHKIRIMNLRAHIWKLDWTVKVDR